jgi:hypothetical protein
MARALTPRALEIPAAYTREELELLLYYGVRYLRGLQGGAERTTAQASAEEFRRRFELIRIFRGLPGHLRERPHGRTTVDKVLEQLEAIKIPASERTLKRDYKALGGAEWLRGVRPFAKGEDRTSPLQAKAGRKKSEPRTGRK